MTTMKNEMKLADTYLSSLACYTKWFVKDRGKLPLDFQDLAEYLDDERDRGQFADNPAVNGMYVLASRHDAERLFCQFQNYCRARFE
jgi:hypothetical protein